MTLTPAATILTTLLGSAIVYGLVLLVALAAAGVI